MADRKRTVNVTTAEMLDKAAKDKVSTAFDRAESMKACPIGAVSACCKHCFMGPCRLNSKDGSGIGVCGADINTIQARNFARNVASGTAAHSDHAVAVSELFLAVAKGEVEGFSLKDTTKLLQVAQRHGIKTEGRANQDIAIELGTLLNSDFSRQEGEISYIKFAPKKRQEIWKKMGVTPRGIQKEVMELMHRTHMGVDQDYKNIIMASTRTALCDGWGGSMIAADLQDILFGTQSPKKTTMDLGVLKEDMVNIIIHGHEPSLAEAVITAAREPEMEKAAKAKGAKGINLVGMCCTGNEVLVRHGVPYGGNFMQTEAIIITGAVDAMVVDVQCIMQNLAEVARCYHTKLITTNPRCKMANTTHIEFDEHHPLINARKIVTAAVDNFPNRIKGKVQIPKQSAEAIVGFGVESIDYMLGGSFRGSFRPLNDNIINGKIRGIAGVVGCNNPRVTQDAVHLALVEELLANDVIVVQTGCGATASGKAGLMTPEAAMKYAGAGLREVCEAVGIPPVLHAGSCVDNSRILTAAMRIILEGGLGEDFSDLPAVGAAPEYMSEKAIAIGQYFVGSGVSVMFGVTFPTIEGTDFHKYMFDGIYEDFGGKWGFAVEASKQAAWMIDAINKNREKLGIHQKKERKLFDMADRRDIK
jgi:carbon-monoxide dehydrogenase catalytic subunit